jgi:hypothetical protein
MQPESQAQIREFNRRLRAALSAAPNHVRMEAALEVESHVHDVLSRGAGVDMPEPEAVALVLAGFGSPEAYAAALLEQFPGESVTVGSGLKEVGVAVADLFRGSARLLLAFGRQGTTLVGRLLRLLWQGLRWGAATLGRGAAATAAAWRSGAERSREPMGRFRARMSLRFGMARHRLRRGGTAAWAAAGKGASLLGAAGALLWRAVKWLVHIGQEGLRILLRLLGRLFRAAGIALLGALGLGCLAVAGFAALAPDVTGWVVLQGQTQVGLAVSQLRAETIGNPNYVSVAGNLDRTGFAVLVAALALALCLFAVAVYLVWTGRRRRSTAAGQ